MSETAKRSYDQMYRIACGLVERLQPACERIEVAGSLRRHKELIGDIEIVLIPKPLLNLLGEPMKQTEVDVMLGGWPVSIIKNGEKYKQFTFDSKAGQTYTVDLFLQPDPATWGVNLMIRTGSADFSRQMVTRKSEGGYMPEHFSVRDARVWRNGAAVATPEEADIFALWQMDFVAPELRAF
jgi:DNA polymerase/3'-5' exonuclease PolX